MSVAGRVAVRLAVGSGLLVVTVLGGGPAAAVEQPVPEAAEVDPCATTDADGNPREADPMCQSGLPVDAGTGSPEADVLPRTGADDDRLLALSVTGAGLVLVGGGALALGRRRAAEHPGS